MKTIIWLRAETKEQEARSAITPEHARELLKAGFELVVERSTQRAIADQAFTDAGCRMVATGSWPQAPEQAFILGVKDLPRASMPLRHRHIYFGHAYKQQEGWQELLQRFVDGGGTLLDIEYLVDDTGRRVAAFGYWAGFTGCAVGLMAWVGQRLDRVPVVAALAPYSDQSHLVSELGNDIARAAAAARHRPRVIIIGAKGRVGSGAGDLTDALDLPVTRWDMEETAKGGPFEEILDHDLFVNCVLVNSSIPPFIDMESLSRPGRKLTVISDVSCDPGELNPVPIYTRPTTFAVPTTRVIDSPAPLDLTAIDHLPSLLPVEASEDFGKQLLPYLMQLDDGLHGVWQRAHKVFHDKTLQLR